MKLVGGMNLYPCFSNDKLIFHQGVAVGVGEIDEATIEALAEARRELDKTKVELAAAREENLELRQRLDQFVLQT